MRVVLDTNILVSACLKPDGLEARTVKLGCERVFTACVSAAVWAEYRDVLSRTKFEHIHQPAREMLRALEPSVLFAEPAAPLHLARDEDDNRLLECAAAARAKYLVTGNLKHFPASWEPSRIVNARQFLDLEFAC